MTSLVLAKQHTHTKHGKRYARKDKKKRARENQKTRKTEIEYTKKIRSQIV